MTEKASTTPPETLTATVSDNPEPTSKTTSADPAISVDVPRESAPVAKEAEPSVKVDSGSAAIQTAADHSSSSAAIADEEGPATPPPRSVSLSPSPPPREISADEETFVTEELVEDTKIAELHAMFPDFEISILQYVLESVQGDQARAVDTLLGMNDPDYVSIEPAAPPAPVQATQTELDEQYARRLLWEEQKAQRQLERRRSTEGREAQSYGYSPEADLQYGVGGRPPILPQAPVPGGGRGGGGGGPGTAELQEQFNKLAETGKKTFNTLVSKVKAKIQEYDQGRQGQSSSSGRQTNWGSGTPGGLEYQPQPQAPQPASYYDPNPPTTPPRPAELQGYDVTTTSDTSPPPVPQNSTRVVQTSQPAPLHINTGSPASSTSGPKPAVDYGKIGLLPKRPVSLLAENANTNRKVDDEEEEELEYIENPFEPKR